MVVMGSGRVLMAVLVVMAGRRVCCRCGVMVVRVGLVVMVVMVIGVVTGRLVARRVVMVLVVVMAVRGVMVVPGVL